MNITDFFDYLWGRDATRDLAVQLVSAYRVRTSRGTLPFAGTRG